MSWRWLHERGLRALDHMLHAGVYPALDQIAAWPYASLEEQLRRQREAVARLLTHANETVPHYRQLGLPNLAAPTPANALELLAAFPPLSKQDIRDAPTRLRSNRVRNEDCFPQSTSGSTGTPLTFCHTRESLALSEAGLLRGFRQCGWEPGMMLVQVWAMGPRYRARSHLSRWGRAQLQRRLYLDVAEPGREKHVHWWHTLRDAGPCVVYGYASALGYFAEWLASHGRPLTNVRGVFSTAEVLTPAYRAVIGAAMGAPVFDCYGSSEVRNIATECPAGVLHVNLDFVVLEAPGATEDKPAPLLATSLISYGMPFIRYELGDLGSVQPLQRPCRCGRTAPALRLAAARANDQLTLADGSMTHALPLIHQLYGSAGIANFQFVQSEPGRAVLSVSPVTGQEQQCLSEARERAGLMMARYAGLLKIDVILWDGPSSGSRGKHRFVVSTLPVVDP